MDEYDPEGEIKDHLSAGDAGNGKEYAENAHREKERDAQSYRYPKPNEIGGGDRDPPDSESDAFRSIFGESGEEIASGFSQDPHVTDAESIIPDGDWKNEPTAAEMSADRSKFCSGIGGQPCVFSTETPGAPTEFKKSRTKCVFCDPLLIQTMMGGDYREDNFRKSFSRLSAEYQDIFSASTSCGSQAWETQGGKETMRREAWGALQI